MIEHVITLAIDNAALEHCEIQSAMANDFFSGPFRLVIGRTAAWPRPQETNQRNLANTCFSCGDNDGARAVNVNALKCLFASFTIDPGTVDHGIAAGESVDKFSRIVQTERHKICARQLADCRVGLVKSACEQHDFMPPSHQRVSDVSPDKSRASSDGDFQGLPPLNAAHA